MPYVTSIERLGRQEGQAQIVVRQLQRRFGNLSAGVQQQLHALSSGQLELLAESLLDFRSPADLSAWLEAEKKQG
jgi:Domain of unknown function (DUF4351)